MKMTKRSLSFGFVSNMNEPKTHKQVTGMRSDIPGLSDFSNKEMPAVKTQDLSQVSVQQSEPRGQATRQSLDAGNTDASPVPSCLRKKWFSSSFAGPHE